MWPGSELTWNMGEKWEKKNSDQTLKNINFCHLLYLLLSGRNIEVPDLDSGLRWFSKSDPDPVKKEPNLLRWLLWAESLWSITMKCQDRKKHPQLKQKYCYIHLKACDCTMVTLEAVYLFWVGEVPAVQLARHKSTKQNQLKKHVHCTSKMFIAENKEL